MFVKKEIDQRDIKNVVRFYHFLQNSGYIIESSPSGKIIVKCTKERYEPVWLSRLVLEKDVNRAANLP